MKTDVTWLRDGVFIAKCDTHSVLMDVAEDSDAPTVGPCPLDLLLAGAGGCTSSDVVLLLQKAGIAITDCQVTVTAALQNEVPETLQSLHLHYKLNGTDLDRATIEGAVEQSLSTLSIVTISLGLIAPITTEIEISES